MYTRFFIIAFGLLCAYAVWHLSEDYADSGSADWAIDEDTLRTREFESERGLYQAAHREIRQIGRVIHSLEKRKSELRGLRSHDSRDSTSYQTAYAHAQKEFNQLKAACQSADEFGGIYYKRTNFGKDNLGPILTYVWKNRAITRHRVEESLRLEKKIENDLPALREHLEVLHSCVKYREVKGAEIAPDAEINLVVTKGEGEETKALFFDPRTMQSGTSDVRYLPIQTLLLRLSWLREALEGPLFTMRPWQGSLPYDFDNMSAAQFALLS